MVVTVLGQVLMAELIWLLVLKNSFGVQHESMTMQCETWNESDHGGGPFDYLVVQKSVYLL